MVRKKEICYFLTSKRKWPLSVTPWPGCVSRRLSGWYIILVSRGKEVENLLGRGNSILNTLYFVYITISNPTARFYHFGSRIWSKLTCGHCFGCNPNNRRHLFIPGSMLVQCRRRWASIDQHWVDVLCLLRNGDVREGIYI